VKKTAGINPVSLGRKQVQHNQPSHGRERRNPFQVLWPTLHEQTIKSLSWKTESQNALESKADQFSVFTPFWVVSLNSKVATFPAQPGSKLTRDSMMKKALFITATALALVGCQPQQGTSPSDSGVQSGTGQGSSSTLTNQTPSGSDSSTNRTNQSSSPQQQPQQGQPSQTQPDQK
jgi:hypothetical protein